MSMLESVILTALGIWLGFFLANYAELFDRPRAWLWPKLPAKVLYAISCPICATFWTLAAYSLFVGFTPLLVCTPPCVLFLDLAFHKLRDGCR